MGKNAASGVATGTAVGLLTSGTAAGALMGGAVGGTIGTVHAVYKNSKPSLVKELKKQSVQFVEYGDTMTLIVPTDKYFMFMSPRLNELAYPGLMNIVRLLKLYPQSPIYIAGFTDNVGSKKHKKQLSQAQAETMLSFFWAQGIHTIQLKAEGYGDKNDIADNHTIHGSADNRRIEIQWFHGLVARAEQPRFDMK
jgi:outer membrane protein OmpA-like peptidoglycan-associated protein